MSVPFPEGQAWPHYAEDEIAAAMDALRSGRVNQWTGDKVRGFESAFVARFQVPHAIALANGSVALDLALRTLGIGPGDEVIVTPRSFVASASCVALAGATPVFADVDADSQNITAETIAAVIGPRTRAVIPVHLAGWPCDMHAIMALARAHRLAVIEDCAQSPGAALGGRLAGSFGHAAAHSFCQDKIITTGGEGGMLTLQDEEVFLRAWSFKDHGKSPAKMRAPAPGAGFRYVHDGIGTNWRMTEMQAAIGLAQLAKLDLWLETRARNALIWREAFADCESVRVPWPGTDIRHAWYKFYVFLDGERLDGGAARDRTLAALVADGIRAFSGSCPEIYREAAFSGLAAPDCPVARRLGESSLMFEVHPTLDPDALRATAARAAEIVRRETNSRSQPTARLV
jgi:dTDP-4-amino-4,6-dideoxygalactose transaminase